MTGDWGTRGDFSRIRLSQGKGYTAVLQQQGRVALDADANEQQFLDAYLREAGTVDVIGRFGGPAEAEGFGITADPSQSPVPDQILIGPGRYYVDGLLAENPCQVAYDQQRFLQTDPGELQAWLHELPANRDLVIYVYLQVWQQLITTLDDPCLREPALGQADTTARLQTVSRVVARQAEVQVGEQPGPFCPAMYEAQRPPASTGTLTVTASGAAAARGCAPVSAAGYQGIENHLYRVEIHGGVDASVATFKWSRENGSVVCAVTGYSNATVQGVSIATVQVDSLGPDANLGFQPAQWVELTDDTYLYGNPPNRPGTLYQIQSIDQDNLTVTLTSPVTGIDPGRNARMRRWDQTGPSASPAGVPLPVGPAVMELESGIQVSFGPGTYQPGDYWTFPARTETGTVEWPPCGSNQNCAQPPASIEVLEAPLACLYWAVLDKRVKVQDCRRPFSSLTALTPPHAIHVQDVSWSNDDVMTLDTLVAKGLAVTLDQPVASPVSGGNFIVTIEAVTIDGQFTGTIDARDGPTTVIRALNALDSQITVEGQVITWMVDPRPSDYIALTMEYLLRVLNADAARAQVFARVRVRLLGQAFFATGGCGPIYLDGKAFGQPATRQDGTPRIDLRRPSGDGSAASDLESWFYLAPPLAVTSVSVAYPTLAAVVNGTFTGVEVPGTTGLVTQTATIELSYPATAATTIALTLTPGDGSVAHIQANVTVQPGHQNVSVTVPITQSPPFNTTMSFQITASLTAEVSRYSSSAQLTTPFTVAGPRIEFQSAAQDPSPPTTE